MLNYPYKKPPVYTVHYKMEMEPALINRLFMQTVFINFGSIKWLTVLCNGIIVPFSFLTTCYIGFKVMRVAMMKHVRRIELTMMCYAFLEIIAMQLCPMLFSLYYWIWGAGNDENVVGTPKFECIFYLYFIQYLPAFFFNIATLTIAFLACFDCRRHQDRCCCCILSNWNLCTMYVCLSNCSLLDVFLIFCISWISILQTADYADYTYKCFVLLNPVFEIVGITDFIRALEWQTQMFTHSVPYMLCVGYILFVNYKIIRRHLDRREGRKIELGEKNRYAGCVVVMSITAVFMAVESMFCFYCDFYEIGLQSGHDVDIDMFFSFKTIKMLLRTFYHVLSPFQMLAFCSLMPNFQATMKRYLHDGTTQFDVTTVKTIGGDTKTTIHYKPLPERLGTWQARFYEKSLRCAFALKLWNRFVDYIEIMNREKRIGERQEVANLRLKKEMRMRTYASVNYDAKNNNVTLRRNEVRIEIEEPTPESTPEIEVLPDLEPEPEPELTFQRRQVMLHGRTYEIVETTV